jgi:hypothetical protein
LGFHKNGLIKTILPFGGLSAYKIHGVMLTGASFAFTSEVCKSAILEWMELRNYEAWHQGYLQRHEVYKIFKDIY